MNDLKNVFPFVFLLVGLLFTTSCKQSTLIAKNQVGPINAQTSINEVKALFKNDSVVSHKSEGALGNNDLEEVAYVYVFDKSSQEKILRITPRNPTEESTEIKSVTVYHPRFKTDNGISVESPFEQIRLNEHIEKTGTTFTRILLYLDEINAVIHLDKSVLNENNINLKEVSLDRIPNKAKPLSLTVWFDEE